MTFINYASREINCKIVYYGPGLCGKTTNLQFIYDSTAAQAKGKLISLATEADRTLFFDFMPLELGTVRGFKTRFHLYTVPGQAIYNTTRQLVLKGVDGIVFCVDSQWDRMADNVESFNNLQENVQGVGVNLQETNYQLGRVLAFDSKTERFVGEGAEKANGMLTREYRAPFVVPEKV